jgi:flagellar L-ring protein precursor FlgH
MVCPANWCGYVIRNQSGNYAEKSKMNKQFLSLFRLCAWALSMSVLQPWLLSADSLWREEASRTMFSDSRAVRLGDILTIVVQENTSTSKDNNTQTSKKSALDASIATFLYSPAASGLLTKGGQMPAIKYNSKHDFDGGGKINNSEKIVARIAVTVVDRLPNRNLVVQGTRRTAFSGETQDVVLRGIVRSEDIAANNTVFSYNVADATISFLSKGAVTSAQRKGWFTRIWDKVTPF